MSDKITVVVKNPATKTARYYLVKADPKSRGAKWLQAHFILAQLREPHLGVLTTGGTMTVYGATLEQIGMTYAGAQPAVEESVEEIQEFVGPTEEQARREPEPEPIDPAIAALMAGVVEEAAPVEKQWSLKKLKRTPINKLYTMASDYAVMFDLPITRADLAQLLWNKMEATGSV